MLLRREKLMIGLSLAWINNMRFSTNGLITSHDKTIPLSFRFAFPSQLLEPFFLETNIYKDTLITRVAIYTHILRICLNYEQVLLDASKDKDIAGNLMPNLIYVSRGKCKALPHHFKAGALNALVNKYMPLHNHKLLSFFFLSLLKKGIIGFCMSRLNLFFFQS